MKLTIITILAVTLVLSLVTALVQAADKTAPAMVQQDLEAGRI